MNLLNRIVLVIVCLALAVGAISIIVLAWAIPDESIDSLRDSVQWLDDNNQSPEKILLTGIGAFIALLSLLVVSLEVWPRPARDVKVADLKVGDAVLSTDAIGQRVEEAVKQIANISDVRATIRPRRKGVQLFLDLHVNPEANLANVTDEACDAAREVLTGKVHVSLVGPPRARLHYREARSRTGRLQPAAVAPTASPSAVPVPDASEVEPGESPQASEAIEPGPPQLEGDSHSTPEAEPEPDPEKSKRKKARPE